VAYQATSAFITAHRSVVSVFKTLVKDRRVFDTVVHESNLEIQKATILLGQLEMMFPRATERVQTKQATMMLLTSMLEYAHDLLELGEIEEKELTSIRSGVHAATSPSFTQLCCAIARNSEDAMESFRNCELFIGAQDHEIDQIAQLTTEILLFRGETVDTER
jgi:hypothetical protein